MGRCLLGYCEFFCMMLRSSCVVMIGGACLAYSGPLRGFSVSHRAKEDFPNVGRVGVHELCRACEGR